MIKIEFFRYAKGNSRFKARPVVVRYRKYTSKDALVDFALFASSGFLCWILFGN